MASNLWAIVPAIDLVEMTLQTCEDLLAQSIPVRVLLVDQGSSEASNDRFREFAEQHHPRVLLWSFNPALPSLSSVWNRGLEFVWATGGTEALVVNSDVRLHRETTLVLSGARLGYNALFVSAVGVGADQFDPSVEYEANAFTDKDTPVSFGGPDFSCFLISCEGHARYPFDEHFIPAFMEDCDAHRRYMLGGDGARIFSVNLPFHHIKGGSRTINQSEEARARFEKLAQIGRAHYQRKWGGPPNQETFVDPFGPVVYPRATNPELQANVQAGREPLEPLEFVQHDEHDRELEGEEEIAAVESAFRAAAERIRQRAAEDKDRAFPSTPESFGGSDF